MKVSDYFGKTIQVIDLKAAVSQTKSFVSMSEIVAQDIVLSSADGRKTVTGLVYYKDLLGKLLKFKIMKKQTVSPPQKFTQEIKDNWIAALESGKYKQGFTELETKDDNSFCCIGVLGCVIPGISNGSVRNKESIFSYNFLGKTIGENQMKALYDKNDEMFEVSHYPRDYSNVLPLIKALPTQD